MGEKAQARVYSALDESQAIDLSVPRDGFGFAGKIGDIVEHRTLLVLHTVDYIPKYGYVETEPKTAAGRRTVVLASFVVDMLKQHRIEQLETRLKVGDKWENCDLFFTDLRGGTSIPATLISCFTGCL